MKLEANVVGLTKKWDKKTKKMDKKTKSKNSSPSVFPGSRGRDPSPSARTTALGEASLFTESHVLALGKGRLPRVLNKALGEDFFIFSCNGAGEFGRQITFFFPGCGSSPSVTLGEEGLPRVPLFPECQIQYGTRGSLSSPSAILPRVQHSGKNGFPKCPIFDTRGSP